MKCQLPVVLLSALLIAVSSAGCADDLRVGGMFDTGDEEAYISFSVENVSVTRATDGETMESRIDHAYLLFYPSDASIETASPLAAVRGTVSESDAGALSFKLPLVLSPDTDYKLLAIANADDYVPEGYCSFTEYLAAWAVNVPEEGDCLHLFRSEPILALDVECLPMRGELPEGGLFRYSIHNGTYLASASLTFRRLAARIDVVNIVREGFSVEGVALCNWRDAVPVTSGSNIGHIHGVLSEQGEEQENLSFVEVEDTEGFQQLQSSIYSFPSAVSESSNGDRESTALIIKAKYGEDADATYYRVNVGMSGSRAEVKANTKYTVTIQSVKGRGATTPEEAYCATESPLVMSTVQGWDIEGGCAMDDYGNFIVVSRGSVEFEASHTENAEVKVLVSKGLDWNVEYIPTGEASAEAFNVSKVSSSIVISPKGDNATGAPLSGICRVSVMTPQGTTLTVDIAIVQGTGDAPPVGPVIPWDMPFALVPLDADRVKIDHEARTIEIDGFDPDCFNSFIDIPFQVYINSSYGKEAELSVSSTLEWPLEGQVSLNRHSEYSYCMNSFKSGVVASSMGSEVSNNTLHQDQISVENGRTIFLSVGAMGPDDPAIIRQLKLSMNNESVIYSITMKPRPIIIDDVVLIDPSGNAWLIMDRNIQNPNVKGIGRDHSNNGIKSQAYHYCNMTDMVMPFKYKDASKTPFSESMHTDYDGYYAIATRYSQMMSRRSSWLPNYKYIEGEEKTSSFYDEETINGWIFPNRNVIGICADKMRVSKMRMYLVSDVTVKNSDEDLPICCYWPCHYASYPVVNTTYYKRGYFISDNGTLTSQSRIVYIYCSPSKVELFDWVTDSDDNAYGRLVRPLTADELESYKTNYLGYGSKPHRLTVCHPDTYESTSLGWHPY